MTTSLLGKFLNRAPVQIGRSTSLFAAPTQPRPGTASSLSAMAAQSTVFAIVDKLASEGAAIEWQLFRKTGSQPAPHRERPTDETPVKRHPALTVWNNPNPFHTAQEFREATLQHFELAGEMPWVVGRSPRAPTGPPIELWTVRPDRIRPVASASDFIRGWLYGDGLDETPLRLDQVLFTKRPNPLNPYRGIGPVGTLLMDIAGEAAATEFNTNYFVNGADPGGMIRTERTLSDAEFDQLMERWNQQHRGVGNAHRVAVLENAEWIDRKWSARDMQFEQLRRFSRDQIRGAWGFPKPLLGDSEDVNRANADAADASFSKRLLRARAMRIRGTLNQDFLPLFGAAAAERFEFDFIDPVPPDQAEQRLELRNKTDIAVNLVNAGFEAAPVLEYLGLPPWDYDAPVFIQGTQEAEDDNDEPPTDDEPDDEDA